MKKRDNIPTRKIKVPIIKDFPLVSVVIPAYNEEKFIAKTLKSLKMQNYPGKFEIIVVDNGSHDKTAQIARKYKVSVITEPQKGVQYARQRGFEAARGELIATTDADNIHPKNWLTKLATELVNSEELVAVGGLFKFKDGPVSAKILTNQLSFPLFFLFNNIMRKKILIGQNFMVKKSAFLKCGGFINMPPIGEDLEIAKRLSLVGKVKTYPTKDWAVTTSHRRFRYLFFNEAWPYIANIFPYAVFGKLIIKSAPDVREETIIYPKMPKKFAYATLSVLLVLSFLFIPISQAHAIIAPKIAPITKKAEAKISSGVSYAKNISHRINRFNKHPRSTGPNQIPTNDRPYV